MAAGLLRTVNYSFFREAGGEQRPAFFDIDKTYPALRVLDRHQDEIRAELQALLQARERIPRYHEVSKSQTEISGQGDSDKSWRVFMLKWVAGGVRANRARCPRTAALIDKVPGVVDAFFSILEAGKSVPAHDGGYFGYLRYHLALKVPTENPPSIRIKDTVHTWVDGQSILFDDSWNHEVYNHSNDVRVVLIVDVPRPMRWPFRAANWVLMRLLGPLSDEARQAAANIRKHA